jgi:hypothetical protein
MTEQEQFDSLITDSTRSVISVVNDSLSGHARHAADLASRAADPNNNDIDPIKELTRFWTRAFRDGVRFLDAMSMMLQFLGSAPVPIPERVEAPPPDPNPVPTTIFGAPKSGACKPEGLRRRGETIDAIKAEKVKVTRNPGDSSQLVLVIDAGGVPRGLYEGTVNIGSAANATPVNYNVYVDW